MKIKSLLKLTDIIKALRILVAASMVAIIVVGEYYYPCVFRFALMRQENSVYMLYRVILLGAMGVQFYLFICFPRFFVKTYFSSLSQNDSDLDDRACWLEVFSWLVLVFFFSMFLISYYSLKK